MNIEPTQHANTTEKDPYSPPQHDTTQPETPLPPPPPEWSMIRRSTRSHKSLVTSFVALLCLLGLFIGLLYTLYKATSQVQTKYVTITATTITNPAVQSTATTTQPSPTPTQTIAPTPTSVPPTPTPVPTAPPPQPINADTLYHSIVSKLDSNHHVSMKGYDTKWSGWPYQSERNAIIFTDTTPDGTYTVEIAVFNSSVESQADYQCQYDNKCSKLSYQGNALQGTYSGVCLYMDNNYNGSGSQYSGYMKDDLFAFNNAPC